MAYPAEKQRIDILPVTGKSHHLSERAPAKHSDAHTTASMSSKTTTILIHIYLLLFILIAMDIVFIAAQFPQVRDLIGLCDLLDTESGRNSDLIRTAFFGLSVGFMSLGAMMTGWRF